MNLREKIELSYKSSTLNGAQGNSKKKRSVFKPIPEPIPEPILEPILEPEPKPIPKADTQDKSKKRQRKGIIKMFIELKKKIFNKK